MNANNAVILDDRDRAFLAGEAGPGCALAMRLLVSTAHILGADALINISSAHIDGCLYHGDSGVLFAEKLAATGAKVRVPTTLNVGALDLMHAGRERMSPETRAMAHRMTSAYLSLGCKPTWTCTPYQAGHRPQFGENVAWGESNAVAFCNSVLGARTNRYGDFLDICAALTGRAPRTGLHLEINRRATLLIDVSQLPADFLADDIAYPIIGSWLGVTVGDAVAAFEGLIRPTEDRLKALGAAAASSGSVGLFHVIGSTPEAATRPAAFGNRAPELTITLTTSMLELARDRLSTIRLSIGDPIDAVAIGSPHLSSDELRMLDVLLAANRCQVPIYACTSRHALSLVRTDGIEERLRMRGVVVVADTCIVVTPILPDGGGVLLTNSGKFAHYTPANTGYDVIFASLRDCVASAVTGSLQITEAQTS